MCLYIDVGWVGFFLAIWKSSLVFISSPAVLLPSITQNYAAQCLEPAGANRDPANCHIQFSLLIMP